MQFDVLTVLPEFFDGPLRQGVLGRALQSDRIRVHIHALRHYAADRHRRVDDVPYGGGGGMLIKPEPVFRAVEEILAADPMEPSRTILLSPQGKRLDHAGIRRLAGSRRLLLICGRYEGVDERIREFCADEEISVGDYVLSGGEAAALVVIDAVSRQVRGVLGNQDSAGRDSFADGVLDFPQYTRPEEYRGHRVPEVLLSGDHRKIAAWRQDRALRATARKRPDLIDSGPGHNGSRKRKRPPSSNDFLSG